MKTYTGVDFARALATGTLSSSLVLTGMVKPSKDASDAILFAPGSSCSQWTEIQVDLIERVEVMSEIECKDHTHPYVRLTLKDLPTENRQANVLASLAQGLIAIANRRRSEELDLDSYLTRQTAQDPSIHESAAFQRSGAGPARNCQNHCFWTCWGHYKEDCSDLTGKAFAICMENGRKDCIRTCC